ncbi:hypothetical protein [Rosistilla oblonga]|uniref:hypothetical protein n=1 Tax=Rosistilla oblonga TaxID=2527990 RepID=UPI003A9756E6
MPITDYRRRFLIKASLSLAATTLPGCGTIFFPERVGQPRGGPIDWKVVALDGVGLLLFVVPGIVAFAVDFYNGTIFLPSYNYSQIESQRTDELLAVEIEKSDISQEKIEAIVSKHVDQEVELSAGKYRANPLPSMDQFWGLAGKMRAAFS